MTAAVRVTMTLNEEVTDMMRYIPWSIALYELVDDLQALWRVLAILSPMAR